MEKYIMAIDAGTTSSRAVIFDKDSNIVSMSQKEFTQFYPNPGWVEHDPMELWATQSGVCNEVLAKTGISPEQIVAIGIANQRETTIIWDKKTGRPVYNAIVWQCRRTASICDELIERNLSDSIKEKTGLVIDAYFSATKIKWILENVDGLKESADRGELLFGTVDSWILWNLTGGKVHVTDYSNASRTMLFNIKTLEWDEEILSWLDIPKSMLPEVKNSSEIFGYTNENSFGGANIPISGIAGDQQSALFGQACFYPGMVKNTYGTGCFVLMNVGENISESTSGLLTTIGWGIGNKITYALEGSVFNAGSAIQWLRDELRLLYDAPMSEYYANKVDSSQGVYVVPAFTGLGAPYWDMYARGGIFGLTRGTKREHIVRATLESLAYQSYDVINAMAKDSNINIEKIRVDGGAAANNFLMQFQSDIMNVTVERPKIIETTALGVAYLAGLAVEYWDSIDEISENYSLDTVFTPQMEESIRLEKYRYWTKAVERTMNWLD